MFSTITKYLSMLAVVLMLAGCSQMNHEDMQHDGDNQSGTMAHHEEDPGENDTVVIKDSPRHQERVEVNNSGKIIHTRVVYPEVKEKAPVVLVIHENKGLNDRARQMADDIAAQGYIAIAPDLLSSFSESKKKTSDFATEDEATQALYTLKPEQVISDLKAVQAYGMQLASTNGKVASVGFCRGGSQSFLYAATGDKIDRAFVFYGTAPTQTGLFETINTPVIAYYGGDDARVNATISGTQELMKQFAKDFSFEIYSGAGHAFMRNAVMPDAKQANIDARTQAFASMLDELNKLKQ